MQHLRQFVHLLQQPFDIAAHGFLQVPLPRKFLHRRQAVVHGYVVLSHAGDVKARHSAFAHARRVLAADDRHAAGRHGLLQRQIAFHAPALCAVAEGARKALRGRFHLLALLQAGHWMIVVHDDGHVFEQKRLLADEVCRVVEGRRQALAGEVSEVRKRQRKGRTLARASAAQHEQRIGRGRARGRQKLAQRGQKNGAQQGDGDVVGHARLHGQRRQRAVHIADVVKPCRAAAVQTVGRQAAAQVHGHAIRADRAALIQIRPLSADLPPPRVCVLRDAPHGHTAHFVYCVAHFVLRRVPRHHAGREVPVFRHPVHAVKLAGLDVYARQRRAGHAPSVDDHFLAFVHAVVAFHHGHGQRHEVGQRLRPVLRRLADAPAVHAVAQYAPIVFGGRVPLHGGAGGVGFRFPHQAFQRGLARLCTHQLEKIRGVALRRQLFARLRQVEDAHALGDLGRSLRDGLRVRAAHVVVVGDDIQICAFQTFRVVPGMPFARAHGVRRSCVADGGHVVAVLLAFAHEHGFACLDRRAHFRQAVEYQPHAFLRVLVLARLVWVRLTKTERLAAVLPLVPAGFKQQLAVFVPVRIGADEFAAGLPFAFRAPGGLGRRGLRR